MLETCVPSGTRNKIKTLSEEQEQGCLWLHSSGSRLQPRSVFLVPGTLQKQVLSALGPSCDPVSWGVTLWGTSLTSEPSLSALGLASNFGHAISSL